MQPTGEGKHVEDIDSGGVTKLELVLSFVKEPNSFLPLRRRCSFLRLFPK